MRVTIELWLIAILSLFSCCSGPKSPDPAFYTQCIPGQYVFNDPYVEVDLQCNGGAVVKYYRGSNVVIQEVAK